jgi:glucose-1-phosphate adenylyltransferase
MMRFDEKPDCPQAMPGDAGQALVSLGVYVFDWAWLRAALLRDAANAGSSHDFGHDIVPIAVAQGGAHVYARPQVGGAKPYWRDVGTLDAYRLAYLDFASGSAPCALPDVAGAVPRPMAAALRTVGHDIILGGMTPTTGGTSTLLDQSVVLPGACVLPGARLTRVIVAARTVVPAGLVVGEDADDDARWFRRTEAGTTLVTADMISCRQAALRAGPRRVTDDFHSRIA